MSKLLQLVIPPLVFISASTMFSSSAFAAEPDAESGNDLCDPVGRLISGLEVEEGAELLCAGATLPASDTDTTIVAVCFTPNSVAEVMVDAGETLTVAEVCRPNHAVVPCGDGVCFAPRGEVSLIEISLEVDSSITLLDWNDIPGSERYLIEVFDGPAAIFTAQEAVSQIETMLKLDGDETVSVTAISPTQFIIGYGSRSAGEDHEGTPVSWMIKQGALN